MGLELIIGLITMSPFVAEFAQTIGLSSGGGLSGGGLSSGLLSSAGSLLSGGGSLLSSGGLSS
ncbi:hypothetical protein [Corynebacterium callunae]|uniref:Uncharacterized protein n=1 Tax=Corynebacterium callunae DSM 20147 TaxID=1121353 RepID=M1UDY5_9CORY|nr:hypothetical protein [Corynebacterium callunae]AGG66215.1 hypothetical protein H924_03845 [Corynebacterium callunae DSM 20147]